MNAMPSHPILRWAAMVLLTLPSVAVSGGHRHGSPAGSTQAPNATHAGRPEGSPHYSDVCFSSRWRRPLSADDPHDTFRDAASFHATRLDWVYTTDTAWIRECRRRGYSIGTALNSKLPDVPGVEVRLKGRIVDRHGTLVTAPWMQGWDAWWGCVNSPAYRESFLEHARRCIDGGALYLHVDDPDMNYRAVEWGGCFCPFCKEKAAGVGINLYDSLAMREFQRRSVAEFYGDFRARIDEYAGRRVPLSCNNYRAVWDVFPYSLFDFGMAELPQEEADPDTIYRRLTLGKELGKAQILTFVSEDVDLTRRVIATAYACGSHVLVPWDVYLKSTPTGSIRYFGRPEDFADLYGFVRACAEYLDGYEEAATAGFGITQSDGQSPRLVINRGEGIKSIVRVHPGNPAAPVVVHLLDWGGSGDSSLVRISKEIVGGWKNFRPRLLVPAPYDTTILQEAAMRRDYGWLVRGLPLTPRVTGDYLELQLPPVSPWGLLILSGTDAGKN